MPGEAIVRIGEYADKFYFIKRGKVEIIAAKSNIRIAILEKGAYFGEIGLLITNHRTVTVRAITKVNLGVIENDVFLPILKSFPEQLEYLTNVRF